MQLQKICAYKKSRSLNMQLDALMDLKFLVRMDVSQEYKFIFLFKKVQPEEMKMQGVFFCLLTVGGDMIQRLVFSGLSKY